MHSDSGRSSRASSLHTIQEDIPAAVSRKPSPTSQKFPQDQYRNRYAQYLSAQFGISLAATLADLDQQLQAPRRKSECSEAETRDPELTRSTSIS